MAEGVASAGTIHDGGTWDNPQNPPPEDPASAPHGWTWDRSQRRWRPRKTAGRAGNQGSPGAGAAAAAAAASGDGRDPDPPWGADPQGGGDDKRPSFEDVPDAVKQDIAGFAGLIGAPVLALLQAADPYCGTVLAQSFEPVVDACLPLMCRSEKIVAYFSGDKTDWLLWGKLAMVLAPVGRAVWEHHVARTVHVVRDEATGQVQIVRGREGDDHDHLTPPAQHEYAA